MSLTRRAFDIVGTAAMGVAKGGIDFTAGATAAAVKGGIVIGKPLAKGAGKVAEGVGGAAIDFFGGAGESAVTALSTPESRKAVAQTWGKIFNGVSNAFVKTANNGSLSMTGFGAAALGAAMTINNSRDLYTKEKARRMGEMSDKPITLTPQMNVPQYEFNPKKRMGALDGGASGSLVFALHNMR